MWGEQRLWKPSPVWIRLFALVHGGLAKAGPLQKEGTTALIPASGEVAVPGGEGALSLWADRGLAGLLVLLLSLHLRPGPPQA